MRIAEQQFGSSAAASPAVKSSNPGPAGQIHGRAAPHDSSLMQAELMRGTDAQLASRPAQGHSRQDLPAQQDSSPAEGHSAQSAAAQRDGGPAQGDFLADLLSSSYTRHAPGTGDMRHDTEGWRCLETSFKVWRPLQSAHALFMLTSYGFVTYMMSAHPHSGHSC